MLSTDLRLLLLGDTHIGFDQPVRPRVARRRRGDDFQAAFERALQPALRGEVDLVVHGGDLFHRRHVPDALVRQAFAPLRRVADTGVPVFLVPGNHERARMPESLWSYHPNLHIFHAPTTFVVERRGVRVALSGFPYCRRVRERFEERVAQTRRDGPPADVHLLCIHHCVEGATVGPQNFTFRHGKDVIRGAELSRDLGVCAVLSGHIHRHQVLERDLQGRPLGVPVLYAGSVDRTSVAEVDEVKGYLLVTLAPAPNGGRVTGWRFVPLPTRPMIRHDLDVSELSRAALVQRLRTLVAHAPHDAVLELRVQGEPRGAARDCLSAGFLRRLAPPTMNVRVPPSITRRAERASRSPR